MTDARKVSTRADAVTNRARILEAAYSIFASCGLELEMQEVAAQAGLGLGTLYGHFANREDLLRAIVQRVIEDVLDQLRAAQVAHANDPLAALEALVSIGLHLQDKYRPLSGVLRDPRLAQLMDPSYAPQIRKQFLEIPKDLLAQGVQAGVFRQDLDQEMAAVIIMSAFINPLDLLGMDHSLDDLAQRFAHSLQAGLRGNSDP